LSGRHGAPAALGEPGFLVVGAYPAAGVYAGAEQPCRRMRAPAKRYRGVPLPVTDPLCGRNGRLMTAWRVCGQWRAAVLRL